MEILINWYNDAMRDQVITMFELEYKLDGAHFTKLFENFYFDPFQKEKCVLIVALDGETVAGFQSFFYWPYTFAGKTYNSFQSGNSLVHPNYRGQGVFQKMLAFIDKQNATIGIDFLIGFPVEASIKNFIKDKWQNIFNLRWYVKTGNLFAFFDTKLNGFENALINFSNYADDKLRLSTEQPFVTWRTNYLDKEKYFSFVYEQNGDSVIFHLKTNKRKKILNELIVGNILLSSKKANIILIPAFNALLSKTSRYFHFTSIAICEQGDAEIKAAIEKVNFKKTKKSIYFIVKAFAGNAFVLQPGNWSVFRSDIDTW